MLIPGFTKILSKAASFAEQLDLAAEFQAGSQFEYLKCCKQQKKLKPDEEKKLDQQAKALSSLRTKVINCASRSLLKFSQKLPALKDDPKTLNEHCCKFTDAICSIGMHEATAQSLWQGIISDDPAEKKLAAKHVQILVAEKSDSIAGLKAVTESIIELSEDERDRKSLKKILGGLEKISQSITKLAGGVKSRLSEESRLESDLKPVLEKTISAALVIKGLAAGAENAMKPDVPVQTKREQDYRAAIESMQKAKELMVEITQIEQEIDYLEAKVPAFSLPSAEISARLTALEKRAEAAKNELSYHLSQASYPSNN